MKRITRKTLSILIVLVMILTSIPLSASAASFSDVSSGSWYENAINSLANQGIISGTTSSTFEPDRNITRAEFSAIIAKVAMASESLSSYKGYSNFKDVEKDSWYAPYINWAKKQGILSGYGNSTFKPNKPITREEIAVIIINYISKTGSSLSYPNSEKTFTDQVSISSWASSAVSSCQKSGVISGYSDGSFKPSINATRGETAAMVNNMLSCSARIINATVSGYSVKAVEFNPELYSTHIGTANSKVVGIESMSSMISRTDANIAVNAAYFNLSTSVPSGNMISDGNIVATDFSTSSKYKPAFIIDTDGKASIQNFSISQTVTLTKADSKEVTLDNVGVNTAPSSSSDPTRVIFNSHWGSSVGIYARDAIVVDSSGTITQVLSYTDSISIPSGGYVIYQRARREYEGDFFDSCEVGDKISVSTSYTTPDGNAISTSIYTSIAAGPRIVKNGAVYGDKSTYKQEGFTASDIVSASRKRAAIGVKSNGRVIIVTATCTMAQLSNIMVAMGCQDAMNLDGGASTGIYANGSYISTPSRKLNNIIYFTKK